MVSHSIQDYTNSVVSSPIVEVCSGYGPMTIMFTRSSINLIGSIELDNPLVFVINKRFGSLLTVCQANVISYCFGRIRLSNLVQLSVSGNIPFGITKPLLFHLLPNCLGEFCLMLHPNSLRFLISSYTWDVTSLAYQFSSKPLILLDSSYFYPRPQTDCVILLLRSRFLPTTKYLFLSV